MAFSGSRRKHWETPLPGGVVTMSKVVAQAMDRLIAGMGSSLFVSVGDANGVDEAVIAACRAAGVHYQRHVALWSVLGSFAGHERNTRVLVGARMLVAVSPFLTPGTQDVIKQADRLGIIVHEWRSGSWHR